MRWSPSGDKLASVSFDKTSKLLDFKTGKVLYADKTSDNSKLSTSEYMIVFTKLYRSSLFCMLHLDKNGMQKIQRTRINLKTISRIAQFE